MNSFSKTIRMSTMAVLSAFTLYTVGCGFSAPVPDTQVVELPTGETVTANIGEGSEMLANKELVIARGASISFGQTIPFARLVFNDKGGISEIADNTIAPEIFGDRIILDGRNHPTRQAGLSYAGAVYGAASADGQSISFEVSIKGFAAGLEAATATASVKAEFVDDNTLSGTFEYQTRVTLVEIPNGNQEDSFEFTANLSDPDRGTNEGSEEETRADQQS